MAGSGIQDRAMTELLCLTVAAFVAVYLFVALLDPERF
ncbi:MULTISPECIES: potassium-transporting ATPase subunit F [Nocardiaceae]|nr:MULTISPECIES: potassium-transporting ATPase subunit F [Rhodococcus]AJW41536.1 hypothetical protein NY08_3526 [Rhodococcus sp. B7740]